MENLLAAFLIGGFVVFVAVLFILNNLVGKYNPDKHVSRSQLLLEIAIKLIAASLVVVVGGLLIIHFIGGYSFQELLQLGNW